MEDNLHISVLLKETLDFLLTDPQGIYVDCTVGGGGHLQALWQATGGRAKIIGLDKDNQILSETAQRFSEPGVHFVHSDFSRLAETLRVQGIDKINGLLADLGVSSFQLDRYDRGFSYQGDGPLDMRMNLEDELSAWSVVNEYTQENLKRILYQYGEERFAPAIARAIVFAREQQPIDTTHHLAEVIKSAIPARYRREKHPAKKTFQAIRIEVNQELEALEVMLNQAVQVLRSGGRMVIITFHSLEDRIVKNFFKEKARICICPPDMPVCVCDHQAELKILTKRPVLPSEEECCQNPRARSAKLRVAEKI